jgi:dipeptidyl aminopeptidase/acylaminoacyl peptidase
LWEVPVSGGSPKALTKGTGIEEYPVVTGSSIVSLHSDARSPMRPGNIGRDGRITDLAEAAIPANFPKPETLVEPEGIVFTSPDGVQVHGQLFVPKGSKARGPALLFFHGGPSRIMMLGWHPMDAYHHFYGMNEYLANQGYVVLSVNYRGGIGYGLNFREFPGFSVGGGGEVQDILGAIAFLKARPDVDGGKIGIYGLSYGGVMTSLGLARASDQLAVGVDMAGVHDWKTQVPSLTAPGADPAAAKLAWDSGALATVDKWTSPVLIIHGDDDRNVPFSQSVELIRALREHGKAQFEQIIFPNEIHDLILHRDWVTMFNATDEFLGRYLVKGH